eukprot:10825296-Karenia_brevis.AAC.1
MILQKRVIAVVAGPPCETFSQVRNVACEGPSVRPLRNIQHPWGFAGLSIKEQHQVCTANALMRVTLRFAMACAFTGAVALMEHPATPS